MASHIIFFYPWVSVRFGSESDPAVRDQVVHSAETVAYAARQTILVLRSITTDAAIPHWLAFYFPIYAHTNLLVYILMNPSRPTATADLALLDICAGHFGHVEHVTNTEISFHFPRDSAALCSKIVRAVTTADRDNVTGPVTPQAINALDSTETQIEIDDVGIGTDSRSFVQPNTVGAASVRIQDLG